MVFHFKSVSSLVTFTEQVLILDMITFYPILNWKHKVKIFYLKIAKKALLKQSLLGERFKSINDLWLN